MSTPTDIVRHIKSHILSKVTSISPDGKMLCLLPVDGTVCLHYAASWGQIEEYEPVEGSAAERRDHDAVKIAYAEKMRKYDRLGKLQADFQTTHGADSTAVFNALPDEVREFILR